jgi:hypothetical protein
VIGSGESANRTNGHGPGGPPWMGENWWCPVRGDVDLDLVPMSLWTNGTLGPRVRDPELLPRARD